LVFTAGSVCDGGLHHAVGVLSADSRTVKLYLDGVLIGSQVAPSAMSFASLRHNQIGGRQTTDGAAGSQFPGTIAKVAMYPTELSAARILAHYQAGVGTLIERSDLRAVRLAGYGSVAVSGLPVGKALIGHQNTDGQTVIGSLAEVARTEGTSSYVTAAGALTFQARNARYNATTGLSLTVEDVDLGSIRTDEQGFQNERTVTRVGGATQRVVNAASQAQAGRADGGALQVASSTDFDAYQNAAWQVATHLTAQTRIPELVIDLFSQPQAFCEAVLAADISTLVTITGLPPQSPTGSTFSEFIEGGKETLGAEQWSVSFYASPNLPATLRADAAPSAYTRLDAGLKIPF
jgi:hypothetical protein